MKTFIARFIFFCLLSLGAKSAHAQSFETIQIDQLLSRIDQGQDTTYIVNFWATWCAPCVKELPLFEAIHQDYAQDKIKVLLVSLDMKRDVNTRLTAFLEKRNLQSEVLFLNERDPNEWIPKISDQWEGVIPATWFVQPDQSLNVFYAKAFEGDELLLLLKDMKVLD